MRLLDLSNKHPIIYAIDPTRYLSLTTHRSAPRDRGRFIETLESIPQLHSADGSRFEFPKSRIRLAELRYSLWGKIGLDLPEMRVELVIGVDLKLLDRLGDHGVPSLGL